MRIRRIGLIPAVVLLAFLAALLATGQRNDQAEVQLKAAMHKELVDGDLKGAIEQYQQIIKNFGANRPVTARALVQMGQCHEKPREFADQSEPARFARQRLAALQQPTSPARFPEMVTRRVMSVPEGAYGLLSPGGNYLSFTDWETGDLAIREITTGKTRRLTNKGSWSGSPEYTLHSAPSRDGRKVAYDWHTKDGFVDLRVIAHDGSGSQVLCHSKEIAGVYPCDWSPDGNYHSPQQAGSDVHDIFLLAAEGGREIPLVRHPANDLIFDWTPDGKRVLFGSDRSGNMAAWCVQIAEGKPVGTPALVKADLGRDIRPMGFARNGSYYYGIKTQMSDVYIAELDPATGKLLAAPILATQRFTGSNSRPEWSDNGRQLLFLSAREPGVWGAKAFCIRSTETGEVHELVSKLNRVLWARWSPDGRSLIGMASIDNAFLLCRIDVQTGDFERLDLQRVMGLAPAWSRDSKAIYYHRWSTDKTTDMVFRDLATGQERILHSVAAPSIYYAGAALSRDGKHLAFAVSESGESGPRILKVMPAAGGQARELLREDPPLMRRPVVWAPDGQSLLFTRQPAAGAKAELWLISVQDGALRKLDLAVEGMRELSIHPDGRHIAFTSGGDKSEVWTIENFLPPLKAT